MLLENDDCDMHCEGCEKENDPLWCITMVIKDFKEVIEANENSNGTAYPSQEGVA